MYQDTDVDATFHIPVSSVIKATVEDVEQRKQQQQVNVAPIANPAPVNPTPSTTVTVAQTTPVQAAPASSFVPMQYAAKATVYDKMLYRELSAVSDEVLECRSKILNNVY